MTKFRFKILFCNTIALIIILMGSHSFALNNQIDEKNPNLSPFINLMIKPVVDISYLSKTSEFEKQYTHDQGLDNTVRRSAYDILNSVDTCLGDNSEELRLHLRELLEKVNEIEVYIPINPTHFNTTSQGRFGASNLQSKKIILNTIYPKSINEEINNVFYLHEILESLDIKDRWYELSSTLWATKELCQKSQNGASQVNINSLKQTAYIEELLKFFTPLPNQKSETPAPMNNPLYYADGNGGVTGIGSGGDPIVAYFKAILLEEILETDLQEKVEISTFLTALKAITQLKIEGFPMVLWTKKNHNSTQLKYTENLNKIHQLLTSGDSKKITELVYNYSISFGQLNDLDKSVICYLDTQILHWYFNHNYLNGSVELETYLIRNFTIIIKSLDPITLKIDYEKLKSLTQN